MIVSRTYGGIAFFLQYFQYLFQRLHKIIIGQAFIKRLFVQYVSVPVHLSCYDVFICEVIPPFDHATTLLTPAAAKTTALIIWATS